MFEISSDFTLQSYIASIIFITIIIFVSIYNYTGKNQQSVPGTHLPTQQKCIMNIVIVLQGHV